MLQTDTDWPSSLVDLVRTEPCVALRHIDASRHFYFFFPNEQLVGEMRCPILSLVLFPLFSRPRVSGVDRRVKSIFFGLATNTLNVSRFCFEAKN